MKARITSEKVAESIIAVTRKRGRPCLGGATRGGGDVAGPGQSPPRPVHSRERQPRVPCPLSRVPRPVSRIPSPVTSGMDSAPPAPCPSNTARRGSALSARPGSFSCDIRISSSERKFSSMPSPGPTGKYASDMAGPRIPPPVRHCPPPAPRMRQGRPEPARARRC